MLNILECTPIAQFGIDLNHEIIQWNKACETLTGYSAKEMIGTKRQREPFYSNERPVLADLIIDNNFGQFEKLYGNKGGVKSALIPFAWQATDFFKNLGGKNRHVFFLAAPILDAQGKKTGAVETLQDITGQVAAEENLRASEERYRILTERVADGVVLIQDGKIKFINDAGVKIFGYATAEKLLEHNIPQLIAGNHRNSYNKMVTNFNTGRFSDKVTQLQCIKADESLFWVEAHNSIIQWEGKPAILATIRDITTNKVQELAIREETFHLKNENIRLKTKMKDRFGLGKIVGKSKPMQAVYDQIIKAAASTANIVIYGESGTGKELVAHSIHDMSDRGNNKFIAVNCGAIPDDLIESEFFGYKKGAFTGANIDKSGFLESASGGTLFLDEIGEIPLNMQVKLLRAIEGGGFTPIGSTKTTQTDVRIIAATNRNLKNQVRKGLIREDFFYRIHIIPIYIPPLRHRKNDLTLLVYHFMQMYNKNEEAVFIPEKLFNAVLEHDWPGNVRELQNAIHRYITFNTMDFLDIHKQNQAHEIYVKAEDHYPPEAVAKCDLRHVLQDFEKQVILNILEKHKGNRTQTAKALGLERRSLQRKLKRLEIHNVRHWVASPATI